MAVSDVLSQLVGASFRDVPFPCTAFERDFDQDQFEHKWPDRDGGHVEATGRNLMVFKFSIPFRNGVAAGKNDLFNGRTLYPDVYRAFELAMADRTTGTLVHPELGAITVKPRSFRTSINANGRDGADVEATFVESLDNEDDLLKLLQADSPISAAVTAAADLDDLTGQMNPPPPKDAYTPSFSDMIRSVQAAVDTPTLLSKQIGGQIDQVSAALNNLTDAVKRADDTKLWPVIQAINNMGAAVNDLKQQLLVTGNPIRQLKATAQTLSALVSATGNTIEELIKLNPLLAENPGFDVGTTVRYFLKPGKNPV